jgi:hypothetical protein
MNNTQTLTQQIKTPEEELNKKQSETLQDNNNNNNNIQELKNDRKNQESFEEAPLWAAVITIIGYMLLNVFGWVRDFLRNVGIENKKGASDNNPKVNIKQIKIYFESQKF